MVIVWVWNGDNLGVFPDSGEVSKYQNMVKKFNEVGKSFTREISYHSSSDTVCSWGRFGFEKLNYTSEFVWVCEPSLIEVLGWGGGGTRRRNSLTV
jgi:hypothetical protein